MTRRPTLKSVVAAQRRIKAHVHYTPLLSSRALSKKIGVPVLFKCENLQRSGSFKFRGAMNAVASLAPAVRRRGVVTHSSGNHGAALACVAQTLGIPATVVVPRNAARFKRASIRRYGGKVVDCGATLRARETRLAEVVAETGAYFVPPYDHAAIIAGQGTAALEVMTSQPRTDEIWVPVGGGGMAAGTLIALGENDRVQVVGAEPRLAGDAFLSLKLGERQHAMPPTTVADGLRTALGALNFDILRDYDLPIRLVNEDEIVAAQRLAMACLKILLEPSSAVPIAALLKYGPARAQSKCVVVIVTGGNIDPPR